MNNIFSALLALVVLGALCICAYSVVQIVIDLFVSIV